MDVRSCSLRTFNVVCQAPQHDYADSWCTKTALCNYSHLLIVAGALQWCLSDCGMQREGDSSIHFTNTA